MSASGTPPNLRRLLDELTEYAILFLDLEGRLTGWNTGAEKILGWSKAEVLGQPATLVFTPADVAAGVPEREVQEALNKGCAEDERWHVRKDGRLFYASGVMNLLQREDGSPAGFAKILRDITRRHEAEAERERLLQEREALLESAADAIFGNDLEGRCTFINPAALQLLGYTAAECLGSNMHALVHHHHSDGSPYPMKECPMYLAGVRGMTSHIADEVFWRKDGTSFSAEYTAKPVVVAGRIKGSVVVLRDITDRLEGAKRLATKRRQLEEFARVLDLTQCMIREVNGTILHWSKGAEQLYGFTPAEAVGRNSHELLQAVGPAPLDELSRECVTTGQWQGELRHRCKDGRTIWVTSHWALHPASEGGSESIVEVNNDITPRRRAEEAIRRTNEALERFAYAASHDLKEPLRTIASYLQLLQRRYASKLDPDANEFINMAVDGAERMRQLIDSLLTYARAGMESSAVFPVDVEAALQEALSNLRASISEAQARIETEPLPAARIHKGPLVQLFQNLISNAVKYRKPDVPVQINISAVMEADAVRFSVRDNGQGFSTNDAERVFGLFRRLHGREVPGTGLGLALCRRIVEHYEGKIWAESEPDVGTTFHFTLPR